MAKAKAPVKPTTNQMSGPARPAPKTSTGTMGSRAGVTTPKPAPKPAAAPKPAPKPMVNQMSGPARPAPKPMVNQMSGPARPAPARQPLGPNTSFADAKAAAMRNGVVSPNAAKMVGKTFGGMGMKKGGKAKKK